MLYACIRSTFRNNFPIILSTLLIQTVVLKMAGIRLLNIFIKMENILCIYRNYSLFTSNTRKLIVLRLLFLTIVYVYTLVGHTMFNIRAHLYRNSVICIYFINYGLLLHTLTFLSFFNSIYRKKSFNNLLKLLNLTHKYCNYCDTYRKSLKRLTRRSIYFALFLFFNLIISILSLLRLGFYHRHYNVTGYMQIVMNAILFPWQEFRFLIELILFSVIMEIIALVLKHVNSKLSLFLKNLQSTKDINVIQQRCHKFRRTFEEIVVMYKRIATCSFELKKCFSLQVKFSALIHLP